MNPSIHYRTFLDKLLKRTPPFPDINHLLHHARGEAFKAAPKGIDHLISVGCSGTWYFNWINETYGPVKEHTGVEFYSPKPADLPDNVNWIANTAGNMPEIATNSADGIFSGQNMEHLWPEDVCGFFLESHRILKKDGLLIIDSPNRLITTQYNWSHPEHTVELTPEEAAELTKLAGFDITAIKGLWLCESLDSSKLLPFDQMSHSGKYSYSKRLSNAEHYPNQSFLWWIEARRSDREPDETKLKEAMKNIWDKAWPERCTRTLTIAGMLDSKANVFRSNGTPGVLMYGPYLPLRKGNYDITFKLKLLKAPSSPSDKILVDIIGGEGPIEFGKQEIPMDSLNMNEWLEVPINIEMLDTTFGIQFRVIIPKESYLESSRDVSLRANNPW
jgi:hypothetical protein